jgi:hypothetical protein
MPIAYLIFPGIQAKLDAVASLTPPTAFGFYNANVATLLFSNKRGGRSVVFLFLSSYHLLSSGFSGISANFYPQLLAWLCSHSDDERAVRVQNHLSVFENVVMYKVCIFIHAELILM